MLSDELRGIAALLTAHRSHAVPLPGLGSLWPTMSRAEVDSLIVALRDIADCVAHLEALTVPEVARAPERPNRPTLRLVWKKPE